MSSGEIHAPRRWPSLWPVAVLLFLSVAMFGDALVDSSKVLGQKDTDVALQFLPWRKFGFDQLSHGNLALWNPHIFGGAPYFAGFQSALLYPPNWLHLLMPVGLAINWITALHVFFAGWFMYLWCRHRFLRQSAALLAGIMYMFSGPYFLHVYAGHLPHIAIMVWTPLLLLAIDLAFEGNFVRAMLLGIFAMSMLLLGGHPQYVYYTGMASVVYVLLNLIWLPPSPGLQPRGSLMRRRIIALLSCLMIVGGGISITAVQLLSGIDAASESVRSGGTKYEFSASFSFPPENLMTLVAPNALGSLNLGGDPQYFGRAYLWETSLFLSVTGLVLAGFGAFASTREQRRGSVVMVIVCMILALGAHTPLHKFLYNHLPGFGSFRGSDKFIYLAAIFLCMLAACGFDALLKAGKASTALLIGVGIALLLLLGFALSIRISAHHGATGIWTHTFRSAMESATEVNELLSFPYSKLADTQFIADCGDTASRCLFIACGIMALIAALLFATRFRIQFAYALLLLATVELFVYARSTRATMPVDVKLPFPQWTDAIKTAPPDSRFVDVFPAEQNQSHDANLAMWFGYDEIWGYDPGVLKRYAELVYFSQGYSPDDASQYIPFNRVDPKIFPLLRCAAVLIDDQNHPVVWIPRPMEVAQLVSMAFVAPTRDQTFSAMRSDNFDSRKAVMLQSPPNIRPAGSSDPGSVEILSQSTDHIELQANVTSPAVLLITNAYSKGWHVQSLGASPEGQTGYDLVPADWALQAIPLAAGTHHLRIEYRPASFVPGKWISLTGLCAYLGFLIWYALGQQRRHKAVTSGEVPPPMVAAL